jgi:tetratricopeptide (TPR) repeat protein
MKNDYPVGIFWFDMSKPELSEDEEGQGKKLTEPSLITKVRDLFKSEPQLRTNIKIPDGLTPLDTMRFCWQNLSSDGDVLLVLDDVEKFSHINDGWLISDNRFKALITSRERNLGACITNIPLAELPPKYAFELLKKIVGDDDSRVEKEKAIAEEICKYLGYLPLAIELVGLYLKDDLHLTLVKLQERLDIADKSLNPESFEELGFITAKRTVIAAFDLSWQKLTPSSKELALILSLLASANIPVDLAELITKEIGWSEELFIESRKQLANLYLLKKTSEELQVFHPLIWDFFRHKLKSLGCESEWRKAIAKALVAKLNQLEHPLTQQKIDAFVSLISHIQEIYPHLLSVAGEKYFEHLGFIHPDQEGFEEAELLDQMVLGIKLHMLGGTHQSVANSSNNVARKLYFRGQYSEAEKYYKKALAVFPPGEENVAAAKIGSNLAKLYEVQGRFTEAKPLIENLYKIQLKMFGHSHPVTLTTLGRLIAVHEAISKNQSKR